MLGEGVSDAEKSNTRKDLDEILMVAVIPASRSVTLASAVPPYGQTVLHTEDNTVEAGLETRPVDFEEGHGRLPSPCGVTSSRADLPIRTADVSEVEQRARISSQSTDSIESSLTSLPMMEFSRASYSHCPVQGLSLPISPSSIDPRLPVSSADAASGEGTKGARTPLRPLRRSAALTSRAWL